MKVSMFVRALIPVSVMMGGGETGHAQTLDGVAQAAQNTSAARGSEFGSEIIVTARRQAENSQKVPIAITSFNQESLQRQNIQDVNSLQFSVPSLSVNGQMSDLLVLNIRGQGAGSQQSQAGVVVYLNEVPLCCDNNGGTIGGPGLYYDLENIQVLKGPQGTLFGRNAMGGALLLQTQRPTGKFEGYIQGTLGNYDDRELTGALNLPIVSDKLAVRVAGFWQKRDGFAHSLGSPSHPNGLDIDNANIWSARATVTWQPVDGVHNDLIYQHFHSSNNNSSFGITALNPGFGAAVPFLANLFAQQQAMGIRRVIPTSVDPFFHTNYDSLTDILSVELSTGITFRNIASWSNMKRACLMTLRSVWAMLDCPGRGGHPGPGGRGRIVKTPVVVGPG